MVKTRLTISPELRIKNYSFFIVSCVQNYVKNIFFFILFQYFVPCETRS